MSGTYTVGFRLPSVEEVKGRAQRDGEALKAIRFTILDSLDNGTQVRESDIRMWAETLRDVAVTLAFVACMEPVRHE